MAERDDDKVAGMGEAIKQAEAGMKLFAQDGPVETDKAAAQKFKEEHEAQIKALEAEEKALTGKDNKAARTAKAKEVKALKDQPQYIDACKVCKDLEPKNGFFIIAKAKAEAPKAEEPAKKEEEPAKKDPDAKKEPKKDAKPKKQESAGLSPAETKELETLKNDIIARKAKLKEEGLSGGQQNKDAQVVEWVKRMNELKEKQDPGSTQKEKKSEKKSGKGALSSEEQAACDALKNEIEQYKGKLKNEFGYSNKDIKADPDLIEMETKLKAFEKRGG